MSRLNRAFEIMNALTLILLTTLTVTAGAQTNLWEQELRSAKRIVDGRQSDLTPLINWTHLKTGTDRPLKGWARIEGRVTGQTTYGWIVQGRVDAEPQAKPFIVKNPPKAQQDEFQRLKTQRALLVRRQEVLKAEITEADRAFKENKAIAGANFLVFYDELDPNFRTARRLGDELTRVESQLTEIDARGHDLAGEYVLKCFAMKTAQAYNGMRLYDHGYVVK
jgi:hypothetical protein